jgi:hypothetical protein
VNLNCGIEVKCFSSLNFDLSQHETSQRERVVSKKRPDITLRHDVDKMSQKTGVWDKTGNTLFFWILTPALL